MNEVAIWWKNQNRDEIALNKEKEGADKKKKQHVRMKQLVVWKKKNLKGDRQRMMGEGLREEEKARVAKNIRRQRDSRRKKGI